MSVLFRVLLSHSSLVISHSKTMYHPNIGIIGVGWVGAQVKRYFEELKGYKSGKDLFAYDHNPQKCIGDVNRADVIFVTVPTPRSKNGACDTSIVFESIKNLKPGKAIVIKSTIPPGTTELLQKKYPKQKFLFNPEFLTESRAWEDMLRPDRQIVGFTKKSMDVAHLVLSLLPKAAFMSPWGINTYTPVRITATEAEMIKYAGNVYFAQKVNWANALAKIAKKMKCDYENVRKGMSADYRIGDSHLDVYHGGYRGFGGYCLPKDLSALMVFAKQNGIEDVYQLLRTAWKFNENLLAEQGLTVDQVSQHIDKIKIRKRIGK